MEQTDFLPYEKPTPPGTHVKPIPRDLFIQHDVCVETRWESMYSRGYVTPASLFYIRNHGPTPTIDVKTWRLKVQGPGVAKPLELSYDDILRMPSVTVTRFIECAGNGRILFKEYQGDMPKGRPWRFGSYGLAEWTGVALSEILERAAIKPTAVDVMPTGLDRSAVERPMPVAKAMEPDTVLAYAMNGDIIPPDHGYPARVVVPGWVGINSIKWVGSITVSEEPIYVERNTEEYVLAGPGFEPQPPAWGPVLTSVPVRSAIALPWPATLPTGPADHPRLRMVRLRLDHQGRVQPRRWPDVGRRRNPRAQHPAGRLPMGVPLGPVARRGHHHHPGHRQLGQDAAHARHHALEPARLRVLGRSPPPRPRGVARRPASPGGEVDE